MILQMVSFILMSFLIQEDNQKIIWDVSIAFCSHNLLMYFPVYTAQICIKCSDIIHIITLGYS